MELLANRWTTRAKLLQCRWFLCQRFRSTTSTSARPTTPSLASPDVSQGTTILAMPQTTGLTQLKGFSENQSRVLVSALTSVIQQSMNDTAQSLTTDEVFQRFTTELTQCVEQTKKDVEFLHKSKLVLMTLEVDQIKLEIKRLLNQLDDEVAKTKSGVSLDFSLEKARIKEAFEAQQKNIESTRNRMDTQVVQLKRQVEESKLAFFRYFLAALVSGVSVTVIYTRMGMKG